MIVKDEAGVIRRCLESVLPVIDNWLIVDTGSIDGTPEIIQEYLKDVPGELRFSEWKNFADNRTEALNLAASMGDYTLIIDADDTLINGGLMGVRLEHDSYFVKIVNSGTTYYRQQLIRSALPWRYVGVLHEFLDCHGHDMPAGTLPWTMLCGHDGARRKDPGIFLQDTQILERELRKELPQNLRTRYQFYLAQSYKDAGLQEHAYHAYLARSEMGGWDQEVYVSLLNAAKIHINLWACSPEALALATKAWAVCPSRCEAQMLAARIWRELGVPENGLQIAQSAKEMPLPVGALFLDVWVYTYGILGEVATCAALAGDHRAAHEAALVALEKELPLETRQYFIGYCRRAMESV